MNRAILGLVAVFTVSCGSQMAITPTPKSSLVTVYSAQPTPPDTILGYTLERTEPLGPEGMLYGYRDRSGFGNAVYVSLHLPLDCRGECVSTELSRALDDYRGMVEAVDVQVKDRRELDRLASDSAAGRHLLLEVIEEGEPRTWHWLVAPAKGHVIRVFTEDFAEPVRTDEVRSFTLTLASRLIPAFDCTYGTASGEPLFGAFKLGSNLDEGARAIPIVTQVLLDLGYELKPTPFLIWETEPLFRWPTTVENRRDLGDTNPGVELWLGVGTQDDEPTLSIRARAVCAADTLDTRDLEGLIQSEAISELRRELERKIGG